MLSSNFILPLVYTILLIGIIRYSRKFSLPGIRSWIFPTIFLIKVIAGIALLLIYTHYYNDRFNSDVYKYFDDSRYIFGAIPEKPLDYIKMLTGIGDGSNYFHHNYYSRMEFWYKEWDYHLFNDNRTIIRFNAFVSLFSFRSIFVHSVLMAFISFVGFFAIFKTFFQIVKTNTYFLLLGVFLLPSVLFWTSGVLKEGVLMFAFGLFVYSFSKIIQRFSAYYLLIFIGSILILSISKFYVLVAAVPGIISIVWLRFSKFKKPLLTFSIVHLALFFIATRSEYLLFVLHKKQKDFIASIEDYSRVGSYFNIPKLEPEALSLIKNTPIAIFNTLFRPTIFEMNSAVIALAALENAFIIGCIVVGLAYSNITNIKHREWFYFSIFFTLILFALSGLTTPVMGALVRYKVPALPFLFIALLMVFDYAKFSKHIRTIFGRKNKAAQ
jgi:hypothetical protein